MDDRKTPQQDEEDSAAGRRPRNHFLRRLAVLAMVLLLLVVLLLLAGGAPGDVTRPPSTGLADFFVPVFLLATVMGAPGLGLFGYVVAVIFAMIVAPIMMAVACSIWAGNRPSVMR